MQPFRLNIYDATVMKPHQPIVNQFPQRRVFRKLGDFLRKSNKTVEECFDAFDDSKKGTIAIDEFERTLIKFDLGLSERALHAFAKRVANELEAEESEDDSEGKQRDLRK